MLHISIPISVYIYVQFRLPPNSSNKESFRGNLRIRLPQKSASVEKNLQAVT